MSGLKALTLAGPSAGCLQAYELRTGRWTDTSHQFNLSGTVGTDMRVIHIFFDVSVANRTMIMRSCHTWKYDNAVLGA
jgi:hypothetical protein